MNPIATGTLAGCAAFMFLFGFLTLNPLPFIMALIGVVLIWKLNQ